MSSKRAGHVIFSLHLGVGHSVLLQLEGVGHVFSNHHIIRNAPAHPPPPPPYFLTSPLISKYHLHSGKIILSCLCGLDFANERLLLCQFDV